jgi:transposase
MAARAQLTGIVAKLGNEIRGHLKTFGLPLGKGGGKIFESETQDRLRHRRDLQPIIDPLLAVWRSTRAQVARLDRLAIVVARQDERCRLLTTIPGVGAIVALSFVAAVEAPAAFRNSRAVGAWLGLTPTRYQSGALDVQGRISKRGDGRLRALLYQSALVLLTRAKVARADCPLRRWGLALKEKVGHKRAVVAVARKLAVVMHAMLGSGETFRTDIERTEVPA